MSAAYGSSARKDGEPGFRAASAFAPDQVKFEFWEAPAVLRARCDRRRGCNVIRRRNGGAGSGDAPGRCGVENDRS